MNALQRAAARHRARVKAHDDYITAIARADRAEAAFTEAFNERRDARKAVRKAARHV